MAIPETWIQLFENPVARGALVVATAAAAAVLFDVIFRRVASGVAKRTKTDVDDKLVALLRPPLVGTILLLGIWSALHSMDLPDPAPFLIKGVVATLAVAVWAVALNRVARLMLEVIAVHHERFSVVNARTLPLFDIAAKATLYGGGLYFLFLAWDIDVTGWLASAGIVGIAVGFAAKDTLSNLFAGVFILADAPYKLEDFLVLESGIRGRVTDIGIRSTRMLTRDDIEIIIPNATMANTVIINESGGPYEKTRIRCNVGVAYGTDVDRVRSILLEVGQSTENVVTDDPNLFPRAHFVRFGDSSLDFQLKTWILHPELKGRVTDALNTAIYKRFAEEKIEIPFPQRDVHLYSTEG